MTERFEEDGRFYVTVDEDGRVKALRPAERNRPTTEQLPQRAAVEFATQEAARLDIDPAWLTGSSAVTTDTGLLPPTDIGTPDGIELRFAGEKRQFDTSTVAFQQTWRGIEVWRCGMTVTLRREPARVADVANNTWRRIEVNLPAEEPPPVVDVPGLMDAAVGAVRRPAATTGARKARRADVKRPGIDVVSDRLVVFRYVAARRFTDELVREPDDHHLAFPFELPDPPDIPDGTFRLAREVIARIATPLSGIVTWLVILDVETNTVLYARPFAADVNGLAFERDPTTQGGTAPPSSASTTLNAFRSSVALPGLTAPAPGANQTLSGDNIAVQDFELATAAPPTEAAGTNFDYDARTNDFAAVNAYFHTDRFFRLTADLGFARATYFDGTTFPLPVDHRGRFLSPDGNEINASCSGNGTGGIANVDFELADQSAGLGPLGLATDWRVALHELGGHGILYDHVNFANLGFAHSVGDSFAAILNDPDTLAPDRFATYAWVTLINRRHDRAVSAGWAFRGSQDTGGYQTEQILSTTHFRIYRSLGGDSTSVNARRYAARVVAYLLLRAVGTLTPSTNPSNAEAWKDAMLAADAGDWTSEGLTGGAYGKVIRWAFEKQGMFQPAGTPTPISAEGQPPAQDVYIDDGRGGQYTHQPVYWNNQNVWNRRAADAGTTHQEPWLNQTNYIYCKVRNRGTQPATGVVVRGFHTDPGAGLTWPDDFVAMTTAQLSAPDIPSGGEVTVGPFSWTPTVADHECILMIASSSGDPSNVDAFAAGESIPDWRLVPHDNNVGQRNVHPGPAGGAGGNIVADVVEDIVDLLNGRVFTMHNPFNERAKVVLDIALPPLLAERGWRVGLKSKGGEAFSLPAGAARRVELTATPGVTLTRGDVLAALDREVIVSAYANGICVGGMVYRLDPDAERTPRRPHGESRGDGDDCLTPAERLLHCLDLPHDNVSSVKVKRIGIDIELNDC